MNSDGVFVVQYHIQEHHNKPNHRWWFNFQNSIKGELFYVRMPIQRFLQWNLPCLLCSERRDQQHKKLP